MIGFNPVGKKKDRPCRLWAIFAMGDLITQSEIKGAASETHVRVERDVRADLLKKFDKFLVKENPYLPLDKKDSFCYLFFQY